jgi:hypothetical protein
MGIGPIHEFDIYAQIDSKCSEQPRHAELAAELNRRSFYFLNSPDLFMVDG